MTSKVPTTIRTYEQFRIDWYEGDRKVSSWTNYTEEEADDIVAYAAEHGGRRGVVVRTTFDRVLHPDMMPMYRPGISDRQVG
jgi:hypothetical protein